MAVVEKVKGVYERNHSLGFRRGGLSFQPDKIQVKDEEEREEEILTGSSTGIGQSWIF